MKATTSRIGMKIISPAVIVLATVGILIALMIVYAVVLVALAIAVVLTPAAMLTCIIWLVIDEWFLGGKSIDKAITWKNQWKQVGFKRKR